MSSKRWNIEGDNRKESKEKGREERKREVHTSTFWDLIWFKKVIMGSCNTARDGD